MTDESMFGSYSKRKKQDYSCSILGSAEVGCEFKY